MLSSFKDSIWTFGKLSTLGKYNYEIPSTGKKKEELKMHEKFKEIYEYLFPKSTMRIDEHQPILNEADFIKELAKYCIAENKSFTVLKESMTPIIEIDGIIYIARLNSFIGLLGGGAKIDTPNPTFYMGRGFGYRPIYLYPYKFNKN